MRGPLVDLTKEAASRGREKYLRSQTQAHLPMQERVRLYRSGLREHPKRKEFTSGAAKGALGFGLAIGLPATRAMDSRSVKDLSSLVLSGKASAQDLHWLASRGVLDERQFTTKQTPRTLMQRLKRVPPGVQTVFTQESIQKAFRPRAVYRAAGEVNIQALKGLKSPVSQPVEAFLRRANTRKLGAALLALGIGAGIGGVGELAKYKDIKKTDTQLAKKLLKGDLSQRALTDDLVKYVFAPMALGAAMRRVAPAVAGQKDLAKLFRGLR